MFYYSNLLETKHLIVKIRLQLITSRIVKGMFYYFGGDFYSKQSIWTFWPTILNQF